MFSEQLAVLIFLAATQVAGQAPGMPVEARAPRGGIEGIGLNLPQHPRLSSAGMQRQKIRRQREATLLAEFR